MTQDHHATESKTMQQAENKQVTFTAGEAAKEIGKSTTTITRAIEKGKLSAEGGNGEPYKIQAAELFRVYKRKTSATPKSNDTQHPEKQNATLETTIKISELKHEIKFLNEKVGLQDNRIEELKEDRDKWEKQAEKVLLTYDKKQPAPVQRNIPWLNVFFGAALLIILTVIAYGGLIKG